MRLIFIFPRLALTWLLRNYELSLATYKVNATIASLKHIHGRLQQQSVAHSPLGQIHGHTDSTARRVPRLSLG
jgi:hypothetical protein